VISGTSPSRIADAGRHGVPSNGNIDKTINRFIVSKHTHMTTPSLHLVILQRELWSIEKKLQLSQKFVEWKAIEFEPGGIYLVVAPPEELTFFLYTLADEKGKGIFLLVPLSFFAERNAIQQALFRPLLAKHLRGEIERFGLSLPAEIEKLSK
jgi:hypothetical protein